jgi:nucleotide-binding universal stress UspA family protein
MAATALLTLLLGSQAMRVLTLSSVPVLVCR